MSYELSKDKVYHLMAGFILALLGTAAYEIMTATTFPVVGFVFAAWVGAMKEIAWDRGVKKGTPDIWDFLCTCIGGALYALPIILLAE